MPGRNGTFIGKSNTVMNRILVVDDDNYICTLLVNYLNRNGFEAEGAMTGSHGMKLFAKQEFDLVLCDFRLPDSDGFRMLQYFRSQKPLCPVIIMTAYADVKTAVRSIKAGAFDYVTKPIQTEEIIQLIKRSLESGTTQNEDGNSFMKGFIAGKTRQIQEVMRLVSVVAPTDLTVLLEGETGSGKEYIARAIHYRSKRKDKPFIPIDCGAIPKELANSELFGHIKGAFTGAINDKLGFFEQARGGTIFLDEVGNLPHENQVKLLRALQERIITRVGDSKNIKVDIRLITATNEDLIKLVDSGEFREDLYHRINGFKINIPALRERKQDILEFAGYFIRQANAAFGKKVSGLDDSTRDIFLNYEWFGNIRELQNVINRAVLLSEAEIIYPEALPDEIRYHYMQAGKQKKHDLQQKGVPELKEATLVTEREVISNALIKSNYNKSQAAKMLNIDRKTLYNKIKLYGIKLEK
jgi:two-component system response regulator HydG